VSAELYDPGTNSLSAVAVFQTAAANTAIIPISSTMRSPVPGLMIRSAVLNFPFGTLLSAGAE
jgi:hypothetical protein